VNQRHRGSFRKASEADHTVVHPIDEMGYQ